MLCAAIIISGREGQTVQKSFGATIEILKVDDTAIDEQPSLVGLNENGVKATKESTGKTTENITGKTTTKEEEVELYEIEKIFGNRNSSIIWIILSL